MSMQLLHEVQKKYQKKRVPDIKPGLTVRIHQKIKEGDKQRTQVFQGLVIKISSGHGIDKTFTIRKIVQGIGVEKTFLLHSPNITKIELLKEAKVRRAKLYYMRERTGKAARLREKHIKEKEEEETSLEEKTQETEKEKAQSEDKTPEKLEKTTGKEEKAPKKETQSKAEAQSEEKAERQKEEKETIEKKPEE